MALACAACSNTDSGRGAIHAASTRTDRSQAATSATSCTIYESGDSEQVTVRNGAESEPECQTLIKSLSSGGEFWTENRQASQPVDSPHTFCVMAKNGATATVSASDGSLTATSLCSSFVQAGWTEDTTAEQKQAKASASASAAAQQQQQAAAAVQTLNTDGASTQNAASTVRDDTKPVTDDATAMNSDVKTTYSDLQTEYSDAHDGGNSDGTTCDDAGTVDDDAGTVSDDAGTVQDDLGTLTGDISDAHHDITTLTSDLATAEQLNPGYQGGANALSPVDVSNIVTAARKNMATGVAKANSSVDHANAEVATAYGYARTASKYDHCGTYSGPGAPIPHIK